MEFGSGVVALILGGQCGRMERPPFEAQGEQGCADSALRYMDGCQDARAGRSSHRPYSGKADPPREFGMTTPSSGCQLCLMNSPLVLVREL